MEACAEMPELREPRSAARQYFDQLYADSPLNKLPDGPYQIALQVQGILAAEARRQPSPERKLQAGVVVPAGQSADANSQVGSMRREFDTLTRKMRSGQQNFQEYKRWAFLRENLKPQRR